MMHGNDNPLFRTENDHNKQCFVRPCVRCAHAAEVVMLYFFGMWAVHKCAMIHGERGVQRCRVGSSGGR
eukprot:350576-Chlamydomonas_euryale.AAC.10